MSCCLFLRSSMFGWNESVFFSFSVLRSVLFVVMLILSEVSVSKWMGKKSLEQNFQWLIQWSHPIWYPPHACSLAKYLTMRRDKNQLKSWEISKIKKFYLHEKLDKRNRKNAQRRAINNRKTLKNNSTRNTWRMCVHSINIATSLCHKQIEDCLLMSLFKLPSSWYAARKHWLMFSNRMHVFATRFFVCTKQKDCRFFVSRKRY